MTLAWHNALNQQAPWRALLPYAVRRWKPLTALLTIALLSTCVQTLQPWPMKLLVDHVLAARPLPQNVARTLALTTGTPTRDTLLIWSALGLVAMFVLRWGLSVARSYAGISFGQGMRYDLAADLFEQLQRLSLTIHRQTSVGDFMRRVTNDSSCVSLMLKDALVPAVASLFSLVAMFGVMWQMDPTLTLLSLSIVPWMAFTLHRHTPLIAACSHEQQQREAQLYGVIEQTLSSMPLVQSFGGEPRSLARFRRTAADIVDATLRSTSAQLRFKLMIGAATAVGTAAVFWVGALHVLEHQLTLGGILVFLAYLAALYGPLEALLYVPATIQSAAGSARRVLEVLGSSPAVTSRASAVKLAHTSGHLVFDHVSFAYARDRTVLTDISLEARPGEALAIVGPTGAGKSTLVSLIPRFFDPSSGRVSLDGKELRDIELKSLRANVSLVLQDSFLFPTTIAENIAYGCPGATHASVVAAARAANAHGFIGALPQGYDSVVGERGATLSGGERQRIAIARAILKNAPIVVLDEPTSGLDPETEHEVMKALSRLMERRTTFTIAHRLSTLRHADRILVLDAGRIVEAGTHGELLATNGLFARLHAGHGEDRAVTQSGGA